VESVQSQRWLNHFLENAKKEQNLYFRVREIKRDNKTKKTERQRLVVPFFRQKRIRFNKNLEHLDIIARELREWPVGRNDDFMDTLTDGIEMLKPPTVIVNEVRVPPPAFVRRRRNGWQTGVYTVHEAALRKYLYP
jgi:hypothetical protein